MWQSYDLSTLGLIPNALLGSTKLTNCLATQVMNSSESRTAWRLPQTSFLICHCQRFSWVYVSLLYHFLRSRTELLLLLFLPNPSLGS